MVYLASIALSSLILGWLTNRLYDWLGLDIAQWVNEVCDATDSMYMQGAVFLLLVLILTSPLRQKLDD
jgi:hypothetical protein